jgi:hypothetical protein
MLRSPWSAGSTSARNVRATRRDAEHGAGERAEREPGGDASERRAEMARELSIAGEPAQRLQHARGRGEPVFGQDTGARREFPADEARERQAPAGARAPIGRARPLTRRS